MHYRIIGHCQNNLCRAVQAAIISPMIASLQRVARAATTQRGSPVSQDRTADGAPALLALSQASAHVSRYYFSLFGSGQLLPYSGLGIAWESVVVISCDFSLADRTSYSQHIISSLQLKLISLLYLSNSSLASCVQQVYL